MTTREQRQRRTTWDRRSVTAVLAAAGIIGPILFTVAFVVQVSSGSTSTAPWPSPSGRWSRCCIIGA